MAFNQVENMFLGMAIDELQEQSSHNGYGSVCLGVSPLMVVKDGRYVNHLTVADGRDSETPHPDFVPVHCYDLLPRARSTAESIDCWLWLCSHDCNPYVGNTAEPDWPNMPHEIVHGHGMPFRKDYMIRMYHLLLNAANAGRESAEESAELLEV